MHGWVADGYWEDVGTLDSYRRAHADVLRGAVDVGEVVEAVVPGTGDGPAVGAPGAPGRAATAGG